MHSRRDVSIGLAALTLTVAGVAACNVITGASKYEVVDCVGVCDDSGEVDSTRVDAEADAALLETADTLAPDALGDTASSESAVPDTLVTEAADTASDAIDPIDASDGGATRVAVAVALGSTHTCVALSDGTVQCWGSNELGKLGDGTETGHSSPVLVSVPSSKGVALGDDHACALLATGGVACWGSGGVGEVGYTTTATCTSGGGSAVRCSKSPKTLVGPADVVQLSANGQGTMALDKTGAFQYWGQVGVISSTSPIVYSTTDVVTQVAVGGNHACYVTSGVAKCMGYNSYGELGRADLTSRDLQAVEGLAHTVKSIALGQDHGCALLDDGTVWCWGSNFVSQLGYASTGTCSGIPCSTTATQVALSDKAIELALGSGHTCALLTSGLVQCWGANNFGELGNGGFVKSTTPINAAITKVAHIAAGGNHTCAIQTSGVLRCWGQNDKGQIGNGSTTDTAAPTVIAL